MAAVTDYITLQGKKVPYRIERLPVKSLILDPRNPRIDYLLGQKFAGKSPTQEDIIDALWEKEQVKALSQSILANGGVREHIIVQRKKGEGDKVREGNCRTASSVKLSDANPGDDRFLYIPAHVFEEELTEEDIAVMIADVHVAKKIDWDAYTQAKTIYELHRVNGKTFDWLTNHLRMSRSKIAEYIAAYEATTQFLAVHKDPSFTRRFTLFHEMVRKKSLKQRFESDQDGFRTQYFKWVATSKIHDPRQVRGLEAIIADPEALKVLDAEGYDAAAKVLVGKDPSLGSDLFFAIRKATEAVKAAPMSDVQDLKNGDVQKLLMLRNLYRAIDDLATLSNVKL